ncbi:MAG: malate permease [Phycisphaerales bacterium]|nr:malate permease [Phycisphaerales bacterium]
MIFRILLDVLAPILLMIGVGALLRWKFQIDLGTLSKLNLYLFVPAFVFDKVSTSTLSWAQMGGVVTISIVQVVTLGLIVFGVGRLFRVSRKTLAAIALAVMFYNSGNYGLPLAELAFPQHSGVSMPHSAAKDGGAVQAFVLMTQNILTYTLGLAIAAMAHPGGVGKSLLRIGRLPMLPMLAAALLARWWLQGGDDRHLPIFLSKTASYLADGLVPIALVTLGAQLASNPRWPRWKPVSLVLVLRLLFGPVQMALLLFGFHLIGWPALDLWGASGWPAELMILTAGVPTAVGTLLLTLELDGDSDLAADCVFWTTVFSCVTIAGWLLALRLYFGS